MRGENGRGRIESVVLTGDLKADLYVAEGVDPVGDPGHGQVRLFAESVGEDVAAELPRGVSREIAGAVVVNARHQGAAGLNAPHEDAERLAIRLARGKHVDMIVIDGRHNRAEGLERVERL